MAGHAWAYAGLVVVPALLVPVPLIWYLKCRLSACAWAAAAFLSWAVGMGAYVAFIAAIPGADPADAVDLAATAAIAAAVALCAMWACFAVALLRYTLAEWGALNTSIPSRPDVAWASRFPTLVRVRTRSHALMSRPVAPRAWAIGLAAFWLATSLLAAASLLSAGPPGFPPPCWPAAAWLAACGLCVIVVTLVSTSRRRASA